MEFKVADLMGSATVLEFFYAVSCVAMLAAVGYVIKMCQAVMDCQPRTQPLNLTVTLKKSGIQRRQILIQDDALSRRHPQEHDEVRDLFDQQNYSKSAFLTSFGGNKINKKVSFSGSIIYVQAQLSFRFPHGIFVKWCWTFLSTWLS